MCDWIICGGNTLEKSFADFYDEMMAYVDYDRWVKLINDRIGNTINGEKIIIDVKGIVPAPSWKL